jgi:hypothetical protein
MHFFTKSINQIFREKCLVKTFLKPFLKYRKSLEDVNARFMEAASSFKEMCSNLAHNRKQPTEDELFGQRVVAFIRAFTDKEDKDNAKAGVLKYLADCLSAQFE